MPLLLQTETELQKLNNKLLELSTSVNEKTIMKAALATEQSYTSVKRYLYGKAKKEAVARKLIKFFEQTVTMS